MSITRTTVAIDSGVLDSAKRTARQQHQTLGQFITEAVQRQLTRGVGERGAVRLPTSGHGGLRPGVTLDSNADLAALLDDEDGGQWSSQM